MRGGILDRWIAIQRATITQSGSGELQEAWVTLSQRPARKEELTGDERFTGDQRVSMAQVAFHVRWASVIDDITPRDRIIYPASALNDSPAAPLNTTIYDIVLVQEIGRREGLRILAAVRQDELH